MMKSIDQKITSKMTVSGSTYAVVAAALARILNAAQRFLSRKQDQYEEQYQPDQQDQTGDDEVSRASNNLFSDMSDQGVDIVKVEEGSILVTFRCSTISALKNITHYLADKMYDGRLIELEKALSKYLGSPVELNISIVLETVYSALKQIEENANNKAIVLTMECKGSEGVKNAIGCFGNGSSTNALNSLSEALSKSVGQRVELHTTIDVDKLEKDVRELERQLILDDQIIVHELPKLSLQHTSNMADNSLSTDAVPDPPRTQDIIDEAQTIDQRQHIGEQESMERIQRSTNPPTADLTFQNFLVTLAYEITDVELEHMKVIFSGDGGIARSILRPVKKPMQLFDILQKRCWLSRDNLLHLQVALRTINRMDLVKLASNYAQSFDAVYFDPASDEPENGFRFVKLHLRGCNVQNATRDAIQQIRLRFAELLFAPPERIIIAGNEPATCLKLTLEVPESYVPRLIDSFGTNADQSRFKDIDGGCIEIQHSEEGLFQLLDNSMEKVPKNIP